MMVPIDRGGADMARHRRRELAGGGSSADMATNADTDATRVAVVASVAATPRRRRFLIVPVNALLCVFALGDGTHTTMRMTFVVVLVALGLELSIMRATAAVCVLLASFAQIEHGLGGFVDGGASRVSSVARATSGQQGFA